MHVHAYKKNPYSPTVDMQPQHENPKQIILTNSHSPHERVFNVAGEIGENTLVSKMQTRYAASRRRKSSKERNNMPGDTNNNNGNKYWCNFLGLPQVGDKISVCI